MVHEKFDIRTQGLTEVGIIFKIIMYLELLSNLIYLIFFFRMLIMCVYLTIIGLAKENLASPTVCGKTGENY